MGKIIVMELSAMLLADSQKLQNLVTCAELDGVELYCLTGLSTERTRMSLTEINCLHVLDGFLYDTDEIPSDAVTLVRPDEINYATVARHLARARPRAVHLLLDLD